MERIFLYNFLQKGNKFNLNNNHDILYYLNKVKAFITGIRVLFITQFNTGLENRHTD